MKKVFNFFAVIVILGFVATGCGSNNKVSKPTLPETISISVPFQTDTTVNVTEKTVQTAPRFNCSGKKLNQPKLVGVSEQIVPVNISQSGVKNVDINLKNYIDSTGNTPGIPVGGNVTGGGDSSNGNSGVSNDSMPNLNWLWYLVPVVLLALLAWFIWWLFSQKPQNN